MPNKFDRRPIMLALAVACGLVWLPIPASADPSPGGSVTAGQGPQAAPTLTAGRYKAEISSETATPTTYWYRIQRGLTGSTIRASVTGLVPIPADPMDGLQQAGWTVDLYAADQATLCDTYQDSSMDTQGYAVLASALVISEPADPAQAEPPKGQVDCAASQDLYLKLVRDASPAEPINVELSVIEEPGVSDAASLPAGISDVAAVAAPTAAAPTAVVGAAGFADAELISAGTYSAPVVPGERVFFRVHLDWGQSATFAIDGPQIEWPSDVTGLAAATGIEIAADVYSPDRGILNGDPNSTSFDEAGNGYTDLVFGVPEVRYRNRWEAPELRGNRSYSASGDYYFSMSVAKNSLGGALDGVPIPVQFTVAVLGESAGAPQYLEPFDMTLAQRGLESAAASASPTPSASVTPEPATSDTPAPWRKILLGGGAALLIATAAAILLVYRRRALNADPAGTKAPQPAAATVPSDKDTGQIA